MALELGSKPVLALALGSKLVLEQELVHSKEQVQVPVHNTVLELEQVLGSKLALALGSKLALVLGSKAQVLGSTELYACSSCRKVQLLLGWLRLQNMQASKE